MDRLEQTSDDPALEPVEQEELRSKEIAESEVKPQRTREWRRMRRSGSVIATARMVRSPRKHKND